MAIQDLFKNNLNIGQSVDTFIGYQPTEEESTEFPYEIYDLIIKSIREQDQSTRAGGTKLLERYLLGPQEVWKSIHTKINYLQNTLFDPTEIEFKYLRGLSKLFGWGNDLIDVWTVATNDQKRKLVLGAISFWKNRWLNGGLEVAIRLVTGNRYKIRGYFDFRWILSENMLLEELQNQDVHLSTINAMAQYQHGIDGSTQYGGQDNKFHAASAVFTKADVGGFIVITSVDASSYGVYKIIVFEDAQTILTETPFPAAENNLDWETSYHYDEFITEIRLVDDLTGNGAINRDLLQKLLELQRALSERFNICYVTFLDFFQIDNDFFQWGDPVGDLTAEIDSGNLQLTGLEGHLPTNYYNNDDWSHYTLTTKAAFKDDGVFEILFNYQDLDNTYRLRISRNGFGSGEIKLMKTVAGVTSQIGSTYPFPSLVIDVYWTYRIHAHQTDNNNKTIIRGELDGCEIFAEEDTSFVKGKIAVGTQPNGIENSVIWVDEIELWKYPMTVDRIGPYP